MNRLNDLTAKVGALLPPKRKGFILPASVVLALAGLPFSASAFLVNDTGDDFTVDWTIASGTFTDLDTDLTATAVFDVILFSDTEVEIEIFIENTTSASTNVTEAAVMSLGIQTDPDTDAAFASGGEGSIFDTIVNDPNSPGAFNMTDSCIVGAQNCAGGNINQGLNIGQMDMFTLSFTPATATNFSAGLNFSTDEFPIKWQTTVGSFISFGQGPDQGDPQPPAQIPEPGILGLLGIGLLGMGFARRRRHIS